MDLKPKLLVSFSGGRTSAYMLWWIWNNWRDRYRIKVVFANTGKEQEGTLRFVKKCGEMWNIPIVWVESMHTNEYGRPFSRKGWKVRHKVVDYETASRNGEPFEDMLSQLGIPSTNAPFCSDQLKRKAIESYLKTCRWNGDFYKAIGIRSDEIDRVNPHYKKLKILYPLVTDDPKTSLDILTWWETYYFNLDIEPDLGNCDDCWKKDLKRLCRNYKNHPESWDWWKDMTTKYGYLNPRNTDLEPPFNFFRGNLSPWDIAKISELPEEEINEKAALEKLDGCSESCEAY